MGALSCWCGKPADGVLTVDIMVTNPNTTTTDGQAAIAVCIPHVSEHSAGSFEAYPGAWETYMARDVLTWRVDEHEPEFTYALLEGEEIAYIEHDLNNARYFVEIFDGGLTENSTRIFYTMTDATDHLERLAKLVMAGGGE